MKTRLLIIEDDPSGLLALAGALRACMPQIVVDTATSGRAGLALISKHTYTCIISDVVMPDVGGMEILTAVRKQSPQVPVVFVTAWDLDMKNEALDKGVAAILPKPLHLDAVLNLVNLVTGKRPARPT